MMRYVILIICLSIPMHGLAQETQAIDARDAQEILSVLLDIPLQQYQGDPLKASQGWGALYNKYLRDAQTPGKYNALKVYLMLGYIARLKQQASSAEAFNTDVYPLYAKQQDALLATLKQNPYLIDSTCHYLGNYFGAESEHREEKPKFLAFQGRVIEQALGKEGARECLGQIRRPH